MKYIGMTYKGQCCMAKSVIILAVYQRGIGRLEVKRNPRKKELVTCIGLSMSQTKTWKLMQHR